jgi:hypothetical protein
MADETIQDDHPVIPPVSVPKPEREPVTIEGEAIDVTPVEEPHAASEPAHDEPHAASEPEREEPEAEALAANDEPAEAQAESEPEAFAREAEIEAPEAAAELNPEPEPAAAAPEPEPAPAAAPLPPTAPPPPKPSSAAAFLSGGIGALLGAAVAFGATYFTQSGANPAPTATGQLAALDTALSGETSARKALDERLAALEAKAAQPPASAQPAAAPQLAALEDRLAKLEGSAVNADALLAVAAEAKAAHASVDKLEASLATGSSGGAAASGPNPEIVKLIGDQQALADHLAKLEAQLAAAPKAAPAGPEIGKLAGDQQALAERVAKLETKVDAPKPPPVPDPELAKLSGDEKALGDRLAKIEAALAAPKVETRADKDVGAKGDPVAQSVAAIALEQRLLAGQPYPVEFSALEKLGATADALAALKPFAAAGAPTTAALASGFAKLAPALAAPAKTAAHGDYADTLWDEMKGLVKVHPVGEVKGDDPAAVTSQISAALARGDLAAARAAFARLPEADRASASAWAKDADAVAAARTAALSLIETSLSHLGDQKN